MGTAEVIRDGRKLPITHPLRSTLGIQNPIAYSIAELVMVVQYRAVPESYNIIQNSQYYRYRLSGLARNSIAHAFRLYSYIMRSATRHIIIFVRGTQKSYYRRITRKLHTVTMRRRNAGTSAICFGKRSLRDEGDIWGGMRGRGRARAPADSKTGDDKTTAWKVVVGCAKQNACTAAAAVSLFSATQGGWGGGQMNA